MRSKVSALPVHQFLGAFPSAVAKSVLKSIVCNLIGTNFLRKTFNWREGRVCSAHSDYSDGSSDSSDDCNSDPSNSSSFDSYDSSGWACDSDANLHGAATRPGWGAA